VPINNRQLVHLENVGGLSKRERIWKVIRRLKTFTGPQIQGELNGFVPLATIRTYLQGLENAGFIVFSGTVPKTDGRPGSVNRYKLVNDCGVDAPRVRKDGSPVKQGRGREQMWRTIKILKTFTPRELALAASTEERLVKESEAKRYVSFLYHANYLYLVDAAGTKQARYRFNPRKDTGPKPPQVQRLKTLYDPNLGKIVYQEGVDHDLD
jgi:hypothetical protein